MRVRSLEIFKHTGKVTKKNLYHMYDVIVSYYIYVI